MMCPVPMDDDDTRGVVAALNDRRPKSSSSSAPTSSDDEGSKDHHPMQQQSDDEPSQKDADGVGPRGRKKLLLPGLGQLQDPSAEVSTVAGGEASWCNDDAPGLSGKKQPQQQQQQQEQQQEQLLAKKTGSSSATLLPYRVMTTKGVPTSLPVSKPSVAVSKKRPPPSSNQKTQQLLMTPSKLRKLDQLPKSRPIQVGARVYSEFPPNKLWYWGNVVDRVSRHSSFHYKVRFDDGDHASNLLPSQVITKDECDRCFGKSTNVSPKEGQQQSNQPKALAKNNNTIMAKGKNSDQTPPPSNPIRNQASTTTTAKSTSSSSSKTGIVGAHDDKYSFTNNVNPQTSQKSASKTIPLHAVQNTKDCRKTTPIMQAQDRITTTSKTSVPQNVKPTTTQEACHNLPDVISSTSLVISPCNKCVMCQKPPCQHCFMCRKRTGCFQKMCTRIPRMNKAKIAPGFETEGVLFTFEADYNPDYCGLTIFTKKTITRRHRRLENLKFQSIKLRIDRLERFYQHVGLFHKWQGGQQQPQQQKQKQKPKPKSNYEKKPTIPMNPKSIPMSPRELWKERCNNCDNCCKPDCNLCASCLQNAAGATTPQTKSERACCLQKMCLQLRIRIRAQRAPGLPAGWRFLFDRRPTKQFSVYGGLELLSKNGKRFPSVEVAAKENPTLAGQFDHTIFYRHVGLAMDDDNDAAADDDDDNDAAAAAASIHHNGRQLSREKIEGARCYCHYQNDEWYWGTITKVIKKSNAWNKYKILFDDGDVREDATDIEVCTEVQYKKAFKEDPPSPATSPKKTAQANTGLVDVSAVEPNRPTELLDPVVAPSGEPIVPLTTKELHEKGCKHCHFCIKPDCGRCHSCKSNATHSRRYREVCLQKMCIQIPVRARAQHAYGFPPGWQFHFREVSNGRVVNCNSQDVSILQEYEDMVGLVITSPEGKTFKTVEAASSWKRMLGVNKLSLAATFYDHVGIRRIKVDRRHPLVGKGFCHEWTDVTGRNKSIYGQVVQCEEIISNYTTEEKCVVIFDDDSRNVVNSCSTNIGCMVPSTMKISQTRAIGGCIRYSKIVPSADPLDNRTRKMFNISWLVPDMRLETHVVGEGQRCLPELTLILRGFKLVLQVKKSKIPNAGMGVFLSCRALSQKDSDDMSLKLRAGELIDLGIYSPFLPQDRKKGHVFIIKNFLHASKCEEWCFDTVDQYDGEDSFFDITDDVSGELHQVADRHIPAFVNETDGKDYPTIRAEHDPEGCIHYLLGHAQEQFGDLIIPCHGEEVEVLIDYGDRYEDVRVRKGYSRLPRDEEKQKRESLKEQDIQAVQEINDYCAREVDECFQFCSKLFAIGGSRCSMDVRRRALVVVLMLRKRARDIQSDFEEVVNPSQESICDNGATQMDFAKFTKTADELIYLLCNTWLNEAKLQESLLSSDICVSVLKSMTGKRELESLPDWEFRSIVCNL